MLALVLILSLRLVLVSDADGRRWPSASGEIVVICIAATPQRAIIGARHVKIIAVLAAARVRSAGPAPDAALVTEVALWTSLLARTQGRRGSAVE
jgi:hypothetical protein